VDLIDLRSDTVTRPTPAMRRAMARAEVGDDVLGEDPTVNRLQERAARLLGKEAALFVPSGTFANQTAIMAFCGPGDEVILAERCHIVQHEAGAAAALSGVQLRAASAGSPHLLAKDVAARIRPPGDIHYPRTSLVCVEQATSDGTLASMEELAAVRRAAKARGVPVYMDGARIFNAAAALGVSPAKAAAHADAVGFCLSKGLCAPVGSVLCGTRDFVERARFKRKLMGGGMRQAGILAAAGLVALEDVVARLSEDHAKAKVLAALLREVPGVRVLREPEISMVFAEIPAWTGRGELLARRLLKRGIKIYPDEGGLFRFVVHQQVSTAQVRRFARELSVAYR
jgi:threonine aldolase